MTQYIQSLMKSAGNYGCYFFCLCSVAEQYLKKDISIMDAMEKCISKGYVDFNKKYYDDPDNFYVNNPVGVLNLLTGHKWTVDKVPAEKYAKKDGDYLVELWSVNGKTGHFARTYIGFNSLQTSNCVKNGKIISYRVCRCVA